MRNTKNAGCHQITLDPLKGFQQPKKKHFRVDGTKLQFSILGNDFVYSVRRKKLTFAAVWTTFVGKRIKHRFQHWSENPFSFFVQLLSACYTTGAAQKVVLFLWRRKQQTTCRVIRRSLDIRSTTCRVIRRSLDIRSTWQQQQTWITYVERTLNLWIRVHIYLYLHLYLFCWCCKNLSFGNFQTLFSIYFQDSSIFFQVTSKIRHFLPRSDIFFQVTSKIRHFLPRSDIFLQDLARPDTFLQDLARPDIIFQDTCKNNALSSKILEVKSDRFLQKMYGSSTGVLY